MRLFRHLICFLKHVVLEDRLFFGLFFFRYVRIDHYLLDLRPCGVASDVGAVAVHYHKGEHYSERQEGQDQRVIDDDEDRDTDERHKITLESESGEDKGVLDDLEKRKIEGYYEIVDVESHNEVDYRQQYGGVEHKRRGEVPHIEIEEDNVVYRHDQNEYVDYTHNKALAEITLDSVPEIVPWEDRIALDEITENISRSDICQTEGEYYQSSDYIHYLGSRGGDGDRSLYTVNSVKSCGEWVGCLLHRSEKRSVY